MKLKRLLFLPVLFCAPLAYSQSVYKRTQLFYAVADFASPQKINITEIPGDRSFNPDAYSLQWSPFHVRTPALGIGFLSRGKLFFKTDLSYWYGQKDGYASTIYSPYSVDPIYSVTKDDFVGHINFHYINWNLSLGCKVFKELSLYAGYRRDFMFYNSFNGTLYRNVSSYETHFYTSAPATKTSESDYKYANNQVKGKTTQQLGNVGYITLGLNYLYKINGRPGFIDLCFAYPGSKQNYVANYAYLNLSVGISIFSSVKDINDTLAVIPYTPVPAIIR